MDEDFKQLLERIHELEMVVSDFIHHKTSSSEFVSEYNGYIEKYNLKNLRKGN